MAASLHLFNPNHRSFTSSPSGIGIVVEAMPDSRNIIKVPTILAQATCNLISSTDFYEPKLIHCNIPELKIDIGHYKNPLSVFNHFQEYTFGHITFGSYNYYGGQGMIFNSEFNPIFIPYCEIYKDINGITRISTTNRYMVASSTCTSSDPLEKWLVGTQFKKLFRIVTQYRDASLEYTDIDAFNNMILIAKSHMGYEELNENIADFIFHNRRSLIRDLRIPEE